MKILKTLAAAISMYTKIPMPHFDKDDEGYERAIMFLPLVGILIGAVMFIIIRAFSLWRISVYARAVFAVIIPLLITGGFHVDGFMDTVDVISSYGSPEKKLEILKDPHIGSFAVIRFATALLAMIGSVLVVLNIETKEEVPAFILACGTFAISRALASITSVIMSKSKAEGMLVSETENAGGVCIFVAGIQLIAVLAFMAYLDAINTGVILLAFALFTVYYGYMTKKNFGGVTGDTAGYYITAGEMFAILALAASLVIRTL